ncbi:hypothetical protein Bhyg_08532, partial [Pseudolycoriella hygida]
MGVTKGTMEVLAVLVLCGSFLCVSGDLFLNPVVQDIFQNFDRLTKIQTAEGFARAGAGLPVICVTKLSELNEIYSAFTHVATNGEIILNAEVNIQLLNNCTELDALKMGIITLRNDFKDIISQPISSYRYRNNKKVFEDSVLEFINLMNDTRNMITNYTFEVVDNLEAKFHSQLNETRHILNKFENEQMALNALNVAFTINLLVTGKVKDALGAFTDVTNPELEINRVVGSVLESGNYFLNIYHFLAVTPYHIRINGYRAVLNDLMINNQTSDHRIWILAQAVNEIPEDIDNDGLMEAMTNELQEIVRNESFGGLMDFLNANESEALVVLKYIAPVFVRTYYDVHLSMERALEVEQNLTSTMHRLNFMYEFVGMLANTNRMLGTGVSSVLYEVLKLNNEKSPEYKHMRTLMDEAVPRELKELLLDDLCIKNLASGEYMYAGKPTDQQNQRHVYTKKAHVLDESFFWQIRFIENGTRVVIKNNKYNELIYLLNENADTNNQHVVRSWMDKRFKGPDVSSEFVLNFLGNGHYTIFSPYLAQYLFSPFRQPADANNNRPVYSRHHDGKYVKEDLKWTIVVPPLKWC